jgi:hypothetical protein
LGTAICWPVSPDDWGTVMVGRLYKKGAINVRIIQK